MKTQNLLHFKLPANTAILPSSENLFSKTSEEMKFRTQQCIVRTKRMLKLLALVMIFLLSGAGVMATNYYTNTSGDPRILNNWWTGTNGTGTHPESFTNQADVFIIQNNHTMTASNTWSVSNLAINAGGALNLTGSQTLFLYGNFTNHGAFSTPTIVLTGNANQSIDGFATYGRIAMAKSGGTATFQGNVNGGILDINGAGGTLNLGAGLTHTFTGSWNNTQGTLNGGSSLLRIEGTVENSGGVFIGGTGTVEWSGWNNQTVAGVTYNNLIVSGSGTKTLAGNTNVAGILTVKAGTTLALGSYTLGASTPPASVVLECGASVGSVIYGSSGTLYLGGDVTVNSEGTGNNGSTISCPVALGAPRIFSVANDGTSATDLTVSGVISGGFPLTKVGEGKLILTANNGFSGGLNISAGMVELGAADVIATQMMTLNGGTFSSGAATGYNETLGSLALTNNSTIQVGIGNHSLHFAASNGVSWTSGKTLNITGWAGSPGSSGTGGKIYFGTSTGTLTAAQLSQITFVGYPGTPFLLSTGELVPYVATPVITVGSISGFGNQCINTASDIQFYTVSGSSLTDPIEITPPSGFEISTGTGAGFVSTNPITLTPTDGTVSATTIYVRFVPTAAQAYSGNITHTSTGATSVNVAVTGDGKDRPSIATNPNPADGVSGVSYEGAGALSSVSWSAVSGATSYDVYFGAGVLPGSPTATNVVTNSYSTGALSGATTYHWKVVPKNDCGATAGIPVEWTFTTGSSPIITVSATSLVFGEVCVNSSSPDQSYTISGTSLTGPLEITPPSGFEISTGTGAGFVSTNPINLTPTDGTLSVTTIYVRFVPTAAQAYSGNITHTSTGATSVNVAVTGEGNSPTVAGSVTGGTTICSGSTSGELTLGARTGDIVRWESSVSPFENWTPIVNTDDNYTSGTLTETTQFRAVVQSGECDAANSLATIVTVEATPVAGTLAIVPNLNIVCEGTSVNAILTSGSGGNSTDQLEYQTKTGAIWADWTAYTSGTDISTSGKTDVQIRTRRMADVCSPSEYNTVSWEIEATPVTGILAKTPDVETVCEGTGVSARIVGGSGGGTYFMEFLQYRTQSGSSWSEWDTYTSDEVLLTTGMSSVEMRAKRGGTVCPSSEWVHASWTVVAQPAAGAIIKTPDLETICEGTAVSATFAEGSGGVGCTDTYGYRYDGIGDWIEYTPATTLSTTGHTLVEIRTQRDGCQDYCNTDTRAVTWAVGDDQVPTISCPGVLIVNVDPGSCQYMVKGTEFDPTYSDNCGVTEAWNSVTGAAFSLKDELFSIGEHTVTWTVKDAAGNSATCSFSVTVVDNQDPTLIPTILPPTTSFTSGGWTSTFSGININNSGKTYAVVNPGQPVNLKFNWQMVYTGSNCPSCITQHYVTLQASSFNRCNESWSGGNGNKDYTFNAPTTPGVYYISLASSWWFSCNQFYTMYGPNTADAALGYIVVGTNTACPLSIVKNTDPNQCTATISKGIDVVPLDNCGTPSLTYTLEGATIGSGNGSLSTYTFNKGETTVSYLVTDNSSNSYNCSFTVTVNDNQVPTIACPTAQIVNVDPGSCQYMVKGTEFDPTYSDNCGVTEVSNSVTGGAFSLKDALFSIGEHTVTWTVKDAAGNSATCSFNVTVVDNQPPTLIPTILPPTTSFTSGGWTSTFSGININNSGKTYAVVNPGQPVNLKFNWQMVYTGSNCPSCITQHYVTLQASSFNRCNESWSGGNGNKDYTFNAPTTPGVYYISLASSWWFSCNQFYTMYGPNAADAALGYIVVGTNTACPLSIVKNTDPNQCTATISKGIDVVPLDNCGTPSLTYTLEGATIGSGNGSLSTYTFNKGETTVSYFVNDNSNNSYSCSFIVTVNDKQAPVVPNNGNAKVQCIDAAIAPEIPVATDNCDGTVNGVLVSVTDNPNPLLYPGSRIYRYSFTDAETNVSYWTFTYNIVRTTPPAEAGIPVVTSAEVECINDAVAPSLPVVTDICGHTLDAPQPVITDTPNPLVCEGFRKYKYIYTDDASLQFEWEFTYTIDDKTAPEMVCKSKNVMLDLTGNASIEAADVDNGSADNCGGSVRLELNKTAFTCDDRPSATVVLKGTDCAGNFATCNATVNIDLRPTELVYSGDLFVSYSDQVNLRATLKDVTTNTPIGGKTITFDIGTQSATAVTDASGVAATTMVITQLSGYYAMVTSYSEDCPFAASTDTDDFRIGVERACTNYTGVLMASTGSVNSSIATVLLAFTITQDEDGFPGDIRNAVVQFYQYSSTSIDPIGPIIPVGLVDPNDMSFGTAAYEWKYDLGTLPSNTVSVFALVSGGYFRNNPACFGLTPITIYKPGTEFIAGGGYLMLEKPSGTIQADIPSKNNFGFNVKYNKKGTNLQGNINTIVRKTILNAATGEYELHEFQVKGNVLSSLTVGTKVDGVTPAVFTGKANLQDVTDPLNPVSIDGNFVLKVTMTDKGEPGSSDMISITVFDKTGGIWFTSRWENKKTVEQILAGGNLVIQTGNLKSAEIVSEIVIIPEVKLADLKVYPNPFSESLLFEFVSPFDAQARIDVYDLTGRLVKTVFNSPVESGVSYTSEFIPNTVVSGMYFYRMSIGNSVFDGKVIYKK